MTPAWGQSVSYSTHAHLAAQLLDVRGLFPLPWAGVGPTPAALPAYREECHTASPQLCCQVGVAALNVKVGSQLQHHNSSKRAHNGQEEGRARWQCCLTAV